MVRINKTLLRISGRILLIFLVPLLLLGGMELILRLCDYGYPTTFLLRRPPPEGHAHWVDNPHFGRRFFADKTARVSMPIYLPVHKGTNEIRVALLGASAVQGEPVPEISFPATLEILLNQACPQQQCTIINAAMTAIDSTVVREIANEIINTSPDVAVIYLGHNEAIGPFGPLSAHSGFSLVPGYRRLQLFATRLKLTQLLRTLFDRMGVSAHDKTGWQGMAQFLHHPLPPDSPETACMYRRFNDNLEAILHRFTKRSIPVILCIPAVNLRDQAPFDSANALDADTELQQIANLLHAGRLDDAQEHLEQFLSVHPDNATACYLLAQVLDIQHRPDAARHWYITAHHNDRLRFRTDKRRNEIIGRMSTAHPEVVLLDMAAVMQQHTLQTAPGDDFFVDHVHFNFAGSYLAARMVAEKVLHLAGTLCQPRMPYPGEAYVLARLPHHPWSHLEVYDAILRRLSRPPFQGTWGNREQLAELHAARRAHVDTLSRNSIDDVLPPADAGLTGMQLHTWGRILTDMHRHTQAVHYLREAACRLPHRYDIQADLALAVLLQGYPSRAADRMRGLPEPFRSRHLLQTSRYLRNTGQPDTALRWLAALSTGNRPSRGRLLEETVCLEQLHKYDEALGTLALLLEDHPDDIEALEMQAMLLTLSGHTLRARKAFLHMLSAPDVRPETRLKYAIALQYMGDPAGSRSELISLCRDEPDNAEAWYRLGLLHARNRQVMAAQHALNRALEAAPWREDIQGALKQLADGEPSRR